MFCAPCPLAEKKQFRSLNLCRFSPLSNNTRPPAMVIVERENEFSQGLLFRGRGSGKQTMIRPRLRTIRNLVCLAPFPPPSIKRPRHCVAMPRFIQTVDIDGWQSRLQDAENEVRCLALCCSIKHTLTRKSCNQGTIPNSHLLKNSLYSLAISLLYLRSTSLSSSRVLRISCNSVGKICRPSKSYGKIDSKGH